MVTKKRALYLVHEYLNDIYIPTCPRSEMTRINSYRQMAAIEIIFELEASKGETPMEVLQAYNVKMLSYINKSLSPDRKVHCEMFEQGYYVSNDIMEQLMAAD